MGAWDIIRRGLVAAAMLSGSGGHTQATPTGMVDGWDIEDNKGSCTAATFYEGNIFVHIDYSFGTNTAILTVTNPAWSSVEDRRSYDVKLAFGNGDEWSDTGAVGMRAGGEPPRLTGLRLTLNGDQFLFAFARSNGFAMTMGDQKLAILSLKGTAPVAVRLRQCATTSFKRYPPDPFKALSHSNANPSGEGATGRVEPARAKASFQSLISNEDYPDAALRDNESGRVAFRLHVGTDGRVTACDIRESSGSAALDAATCRLLKSRARFTPAHDATGRAVEDTVDSDLNWTLPRKG